MSHRLRHFVQHRINSTSAKAFTLVEAMVSMVIIGGMLVAALNTVGASRMSGRQLGEQAVGRHLALQLLTESLRQPFDGNVALGPGGGEDLTGNRSLYNDLDDYNGWSASPPQDKDGTVKTEYTGWARSVKIDWVLPSDPQRVVNYGSGVMRVTVRVSCNGQQEAMLECLRTTEWDNPLPELDSE